MATAGLDHRQIALLRHALSCLDLGDLTLDTPGDEPSSVEIGLYSAARLE